MAGINKVILVGHLGKDPEVRTLENGTKVATFSLATSESYKDKNGNKVEKTEWHNVVVWRQLAEITEKYVKKGQLLYIEGKLRTRSWEKDGQKHYTTEIVADQMTMLGGKKEESSSNAQQSSSNTYAQDEADTDLPF